MTNKLLLIRGLGHSGTTILDLALGAHPQMVGLGEAARSLERPTAAEADRGPARLRGELRFERRCTCGQIAAECSLWGPVLAWLPEHDHLPLAVKMQRLLQALDQARDPHTPAPAWVVDSYQGDFELPFVQDPGLEIRIVHLTRDVRSWVHSRSRSARDRGQRCAGVRPLLRWCRVNARHDRLLQRSPHPVMRVGYEELALQPEATLARLCRWLGLEMEETMLQPGCFSSSHLLAGNRMRFDPERSGSIRCDGSWMTGPAGVAQLALTCPWVASLNKRLVYPSLLAPR